MTMDERYMPEKIEAKWQKRWREEDAYAVGGGGEPFYILEMFPYPSGKLHMGHMRVYSIGDVLARFKRLQGYDVLHPMGWDSFGLPAENAAIEDGIPPQIRTPKNIAAVKEQMEHGGFSFDWEREITTSEPEYYRWNQWFFLKMLEKGLVYKKKSTVNWCHSCNTVLANEQVVNGKCWRGHSDVTTTTIDEWAFKITAYAEELLADLDKLSGWPERIVTMQRNWIGKSQGARVFFAIDGDKEGRKIEIFTTRVDTIFGCSFLSLAPEHALALEITAPERKAEVTAFIDKMRKTDKIERTAEGGKKEGVFTGAFAINPYTGDKVPIYLANFVLAEYGTGAVMAVPAHDQRDFDFARQYNIPIHQVIAPADGSALPEELTAAYTADGILHHSGDFSGLTSAEARQKLALFAEEKGFGRPTIQYHLRDWGISRQRYWGTPIPIINCPKCGQVPVPEKDLPVLLPDFADIYKMKESGGAPLAKLESFVNCTCPKCGGAARRETETMDTFVDSAWYFARFIDAKNKNLPFAKEAADRYLPIDVYLGGPEHAVMHLLYFRFFTKVMRDLGLLNIDEPVKHLITQGMVNAYSFRCPDHGYFPPAALEISSGAPPKAKCPKCGKELEVLMEKMSKSKKNGMAPEELISKYGADTARLYVLFAAPPEKDLEWNDAGVEGLLRFIQRIYRLYATLAEGVSGVSAATSNDGLDAPSLELRKLLHRTLQKVTEELGVRYHFNTAIAALMEFINGVYQSGVLDDPQKIAAPLRLELLEKLAIMISPLAPHVAETFWEALGYKTLIAKAHWPEVDKAAIAEDNMSIVVQVNGKLRGEVVVPVGADQETVLAAAKNDERIARHLEGVTVKKVIYVPKRLLNLVVVK